MTIVDDGKYKIKGLSKYFFHKYGDSNPVIEIERQVDFHKFASPAAFLYLGRALAEDLPLRDEEGKDTYYGHVNGLGEFVHSSELEEI